MNRFFTRVLPMAAAVLLSTSVHAAPQTAAPKAPGYRVINLMPAYWDFHAKTKDLAPEAQAALFTRQIARRYPDVYAARVIGIPDGKEVEAEIARRYQLVSQMIGPQMDVMRNVSDRIAADLKKYETTFRKTFPDLAYSGDIYFLHSVGGFDGAVRTINDRSTLLFGLDMITFVYGKDANPEPFFHHELFHLYHGQFREDRPHDVIGALWSEGLATYVAQALNPGTGGVEIFGIPRNTPARVLADVPGLAKGLRAVLDSTDSADYRRYFNGKDENAEVPARSGYVMGYLVAKKLAKRHSLQELAHMPVRVLRPEIEQALAELEAGEKVTFD